MPTWPSAGIVPAAEIILGLSCVPEAILRAALNMHQNVYGPEPMVLQSTEAGHPLYLRLGFRDTASFTVYLTK